MPEAVPRAGCSPKDVYLKSFPTDSLFGNCSQPEVLPKFLKLIWLRSNDVSGENIFKLKFKFVIDV